MDNPFYMMQYLLGIEQQLCKEIFRLKTMLLEAEIPFEMREWNGGYQIGYPVIAKRKRVVSVIENIISYGHEDDKLEIMGLLTPEEKKQDMVAGYLTAEDVFERIKAHWKKSSGGRT